MNEIIKSEKIRKERKKKEKIPFYYFVETFDNKDLLPVFQFYMFYHYMFHIITNVRILRK